MNTRNNNISTIQKIVAYLMVFATISLFATLRGKENLKSATEHISFSQSVEESITESIKFLYNEDLNTSSCEYLDSTYTKNLIKKFKDINSISNKSDFNLSNVLLKKDKIFFTNTSEGRNILYIGTIELKWTNKETGISTEEVYKKIQVSMRERSEKYYVTDITITNKED